MITKKMEKVFKKICRIDPRIEDLYQEIKKIQDVPSTTHFCANEVWYGYGKYYNHPSFKARMSRLAGWSAEHHDLRTSEVYDVVYETLYDVLPPCRKCGCL